MACLIDQELTFENGYSSTELPDADYSNYVLIIGNLNLPYIGTEPQNDYKMVEFGESLESFPQAWFEVGNDREDDSVEMYYYLDEQTGATGTFNVSLCEKEDSDECPDTPLSESISEKYADYIDSNGNFVPKASSGGDCDFTIATLRIVDKDGRQLAGQTPLVIGSVAFIYQNMLAVSNTFPLTFADYQVPLYNSSLLLNFDSTNIVSISGDIEYSGGLYRIFGDATISVKSNGAN